MSKEELFDLVKSKSNTYCIEKVFAKHFKEFYEEVLSLNFPDNFRFSQKLYHYFNNDYDLTLGTCAMCGKRCVYLNINEGYRKHCSLRCRSNDNEVKEKEKRTCLERYGEDNVFKSKMFKDELKQKNLERYGVEHYTQTDDFKNKSKQTCLEKYGVEYFTQTAESKEKYSKICLEKYGVENVFQAEEVMNNIKEKNLERYGVEYYPQSDEYKVKAKKTNLEKYGVNCYSKTKECKEKVKQINLEKYGVEYYTQTEEYNKKVKESSLEKFGTEHHTQTADYKAKRKQLMIEKYGVECYSQTEEYKIKQYITKKKNNSFNSSTIERQLMDVFANNNINYKYQYRDEERYPYNCDFYLIDYDLFVEIQGNWTHGKHQFDENNEDDLKILNEWKVKSANSDYYNNAINVWTVSDVEKRNIAKQNNLNYLEIYSIDIDECISKIKEKII